MFVISDDENSLENVIIIFDIKIPFDNILKRRESNPRSSKQDW